MESKGILFLLNMVNVWAGEDEEFPKVLRFTLCYVLATDLCVSFFFFFYYPPTLKKMIGDGSCSKRAATADTKSKLGNTNFQLCNKRYCVCACACACVSVCMRVRTC